MFVSVFRLLTWKFCFRLVVTFILSRRHITANIKLRVDFYWWRCLRGKSSSSVCVFLLLYWSIWLTLSIYKLIGVVVNGSWEWCELKRPWAVLRSTCLHDVRKMRETRKPERQVLDWRIEPETVDLEIRSRSVEHHSAVEPSAKYERGRTMYDSGPARSTSAHLLSI
jgi:hypothetical protein